MRTIGGPEKPREPDVSTNWVVVWALIALGSVLLDFQVKGESSYTQIARRLREHFSPKVQEQTVTRERDYPTRRASAPIGGEASDDRPTSSMEESTVPAAVAEEPEYPTEVATEPEKDAVKTGWYQALHDTPVLGAPDFSAQVVGRLPKGRRVWVVGDDDGFFEVRSTTGKPPGFVNHTDVAFDPEYRR